VSPVDRFRFVYTLGRRIVYFRTGVSQRTEFIHFATERS